MVCFKLKIDTVVFLISIVLIFASFKNTGYRMRPYFQLLKNQSYSFEWQQPSIKMYTFYEINDIPRPSTTFCYTVHIFYLIVMSTFTWKGLLLLFWLFFSVSTLWNRMFFFSFCFGFEWYWKRFRYMISDSGHGDCTFIFDSLIETVSISISISITRLYQNYPQIVCKLLFSIY